MSYARWAMVTVPLIVFLGFLSGAASNSGFGNGWFVALERPSWFPPSAAFGIVWTILYIAIGFAVAMILNARRARGRSLALGLFTVQLLMNFAWSPLFFAAHQVTLAFWLLLAILIVASITTWAFWQVRRNAALLMLPYLAWLAFASVLNFEMDRLNPDAETQRADTSTQFILPE